MRITWNLPLAGGDVHIFKDDDEVMSFCESLIKLGFTPQVTQE